MLKLLQNRVIIHLTHTVSLVYLLSTSKLEQKKTKCVHKQAESLPGNELDTGSTLETLRCLLEPHSPRCVGLHKEAATSRLKLIEVIG